MASVSNSGHGGLRLEVPKSPETIQGKSGRCGGEQGIPESHLLLASYVTAGWATYLTSLNLDLVISELEMASQSYGEKNIVNIYKEFSTVPKT